MDFNTVLLPYGDQWRLHRRFFHQAFRADCVARFAPLQQQKSFQLLHRLLEGPSQFPEHIFEYVVAPQRPWFRLCNRMTTSSLTDTQHRSL